MSEKFEHKVDIKNELRKVLIFGFESKLSIANVLMFFGYDVQVMSMMQKLSHSTRAFIYNANYLPGFLVHFNIVKYLEQQPY